MSNFIDLHQELHNKGWITAWEFNEAIDLYKYNSCITVAECESVNSSYKTDIDENNAWLYHLGSLTNGERMFYQSALASFNGNLSSLTDGTRMFYNTPLESFSGDLSSLTHGHSMFRFTALASWNIALPSLTHGASMFLATPLESFSEDLSSLTDGYMMFFGSALTSWNIDLTSLTDGSWMFSRSALESFNGDLSNLTDGGYMFDRSALTSWNIDLTSLTDGSNMFCNTALESFNGDLSNLVDGQNMFKNNQPRNYKISYPKMVDGKKTTVIKTVVSNGLKSFISNLSSLENGYHMFGSGDEVEYTYIDDDGNEVIETTNDVAPLDEESIMLIADTIQDIKGLDLTGDNDGQIWLGYDSSITDTTNINTYCDQIAAKGWTVYLNGSLQTANNDAIETISLTDENVSPIVIPHYYKPVQVTDEEIAEYVDQNGNLFIIVGAQHVFGDDISTYGMFTSYQHAIEQISFGLGLTPYVKPTEETTEE